MTSLSQYRQPGSGNITMIHNKKIYTEHEMEVDGQVLKEVKEYTDQTTLDGGEPYKTISVHTRSIGWRRHELIETKSGGQVVASRVNTSLSEEEVRVFEEDWNKQWQPSIDFNELQEYETDTVAAVMNQGAAKPIPEL